MYGTLDPAAGGICIPGERKPKQTSNPANDSNLNGEARAVRCRLLDRLANRCSSEAVSDFGLCAHHLAEAYREFEMIALAHRAGRAS